MNFYLIRHGNEPAIAGDPALSEMGIKRAQITAKYLADKNISQIISSPLKRALETAQEIGRVLRLAVTIDKRLRERLNFGDDPDLNLEQFLKLWNKTTTNRDFQPKIGESSRGKGQQMLAVLNDSEDQFPGQNIVLLTHGGAIYDLLRNLFSDEYLKTVKPDFLQHGILNCSITLLVKDKSYFELQEFGYVGHLSQTDHPRL